MNLVLDDSLEEKAGGEKVAIGMVVRSEIIQCPVVENIAKRVC